MEAVISIRLAHQQAEFALESDAYELLREQLEAARSAVTLRPTHASC
jgi:hypothetical protein